ncbi:MAG: winged helix-turn-helix domain-containing protein [Thermoplasmata archaeon]
MFTLKETDKALLDPSRFHIYFYLLKNGPRTVSDLAKEIDIYDAGKKNIKKLSKTAVSKHCKILEEAGLLLPEARFKGKQGIGKIYKATQKSRWEEFAVLRGLNPKKLPDEVYKKMDELAFHPKYLKIVEKELPVIKDIGLMRQKERLDSVLFEKKEKIFAEIEKDADLKPIYEDGFKKFFRFLLKGEQ